MAYYAQMDENDIVYVISENPYLEGNNIVEIPSFDISLLGKRYNRETQQFEEVELENCLSPPK